MTITELAQAKKYLFWDIKDFESLSVESIVYHIINYGDFDDIKQMIEILGIKQVANIFDKQIKNKRQNYDPKIKNYFKLYFKKYA